MGGLRNAVVGALVIFAAIAAVLFVSARARPQRLSDPCDVAAELWLRGDAHAARELLIEARASGHREAARPLGMLLREAGDLEGSLSCLLECPPGEELGFTLTALGRHEDAVLVFSRIRESAGDYAEQTMARWNLAAALWNAGHPARPWVEDALTALQPHDEIEAMALCLLASEAPPSEAAALLAHAEYLTGDT